MPTGVIKKVVPHRGFGFIRSDGGTEDLFFHQSALQERSIKDLERGETVEYRIAAEIGENGKPQIVWVRVTEKVAEAVTTEFRQLPRQRRALRRKPTWRNPG